MPSGRRRAGVKILQGSVGELELGLVGGVKAPREGGLGNDASLRKGLREMMRELMGASVKGEGIMSYLEKDES